MDGENNKWSSFVLAFLLTLAVLGVIMVLTVIAVQPAMPKTKQESVSQQEPSYRPPASDSLTLLAAGVGKKGAMDFLLIRFNPQYGQIPLTLLPPETAVSLSGEEMTLKEAFEKAGGRGAKAAVAETLGIVVDRYAKLSTDAFLEIAQKTGTVVYTLPYDIAYNKDGYDISIPAGERRLDGKDVLDLFTYPPFQRNQLEKSEVLGGLMAEIVNQNLDAASQKSASTLFKLAVNLVDTDISYADFELRRKSADFISGIDAQISASFPVQGAYENDGHLFRLSEDFCDQLRRYFQPAG